MRGYTAHVDTFARDRLPPHEQWPDLVFELDELKYPPRLNCAHALVDVHVAAGRGERPAVVCGGTHWTYAELNAQSNRIANVLTRELGMVPGNRVLLRAPNNPMLIATWLAVAKAGGVVVATMPLLRTGELKDIVEKAQIGLALCDRRLLDDLAPVRAEASALRRIVCFGNGELEALMEAQPDNFETVETAQDDVALLAFTSGTTGAPKACMHFHRDILVMADTFARHILRTGEDDVYAGTPPLAFTFGLGAEMVFPLRFGATAALIETPGPEPLLETVKQHRATCIFSAPTGYRAMLQMLPDYDVSSLRQCVSAGETLPRPTSDAWYDATGIRIIDGIGATEMIHIFISAAGDAIRPGATGKPVPGYRACILDEDDKPLPGPGTGRLAVKGPTGCRYLDDLERQRDYVIGGWNVTGDVYRLDEDGYFWYLARADDMIISSGYNIAGPEVEAALLAHEAVAECAVVGVPDPERGQIVKAFVVLHDAAQAGDALADALKRFVKTQIAPYKYPRQVEFVQILPKTQTGKLQRFRLRKQEQQRASEGRE